MAHSALLKNERPSYSHLNWLKMLHSSWSPSWVWGQLILRINNLVSGGGVYTTAFITYPVKIRRRVRVRRDLKHIILSLWPFIYFFFCIFIQKQSSDLWCASQCATWEKKKFKFMTECSQSFSCCCWFGRRVVLFPRYYNRCKAKSQTVKCYFYSLKNIVLALNQPIIYIGLQRRWLPLH